VVAAVFDGISAADYAGRRTSNPDRGSARHRNDQGREGATVRGGDVASANPPAIGGTRRRGLPSPVLAAIDAARKSVEGRAIRVEVRKKSDVEVVQNLAIAKMSTWGSPLEPVMLL
jgi:hypothetical protein